MPARTDGRSLAELPIVALVAALSASSAAAQERPISFVDAAAVVPGLIVEARYFGAHNFVGRPIEGYERPVCLLTREAADALAIVARDLATMRLVLKAFDCYRPTHVRSRISCAGRRTFPTSPARPNSIPTSTSATCFATATSPSAPDTRAARPWT
jgi:D-alanyl-D-alanine dipeptidase